MQRLQAASIGWRLRVADAIIILVVFITTLAIRESVRLIWPYDFFAGPPLLQEVNRQNQGQLIFFMLPIWMLCLHLGNAYQEIQRLRTDVLLIRIGRAVLTALGLLLAVIFILKPENPASRSFMLLFTGLSWLGLSGVRLLRIESTEPPANILALGNPEEVAPFLEVLQRHPSWGLRMVGVLTPDDQKDFSQVSGVPVLGRISQLPETIARHTVAQVFLTGRTWDTAILRQVADICEEVGVTLSMDANFLSLQIARAEVRDYEGWSVLSFSSTPADEGALAIKRGIDVVGSSLALLVMAPVLVLIALAIKLEDGGPIFFSQERSGLYGRKFFMHKFRSMVVDAEARKAELQQQNEMSGPAFKMKKDPRITRIGSFIRKTSLDEWPQFWNVLIGEMSLVGPRPPIPSEVERYERWQMRRLSMKPGITCIWQVSGRNTIDFDTWMRLDLEYIDSWSLFLDFKLLLKTLPAVISGSGAR
jgi:exopolysaccharide biosynthesis polyprenyl glycosylphosphotransferase